MIGYRKVLLDICNHGWLQEDFTGAMQSWLVTGKFYRRNAIMVGYMKVLQEKFNNGWGYRNPLLDKCNHGWLQESFLDKCNHGWLQEGFIR